MKYIIPEVPPSNNRYIGRENRWEYQAEKKRWAQLIGYLCTPKPEKPLKRATVILCYHFRDNRRRDPDNYSGKMILDGLVHAGILKDDSFSCIDLVLRQGKANPKNPVTEIEVKPYETTSDQP